MALTKPTSLQSNVEYLAHQERQCFIQFLMTFRDDFEGLRGSILHHHPNPSIDMVVSELLVEETCLKTCAGKGPFPNI